MFWNKLHRLMKVMTEIGLFVLVWVIAGSVALGIGMIVWDSFKPKPEEVKIEAKLYDKSDSKTKITLKVGSVNKYGKLWLAEIDETKDSYSIEYRSSSSITRNLLITPEGSNKAFLLFDSYKNKVSAVKTLPDYDRDPKVIIFTYIKNFNDSVDEKTAKSSVILLSPNADRKKVIVEEADKVIKTDILHGDELNVIYFKDGKLFSAIYSLKDYKSLSAPVVFDLKDTNLKDSKLMIGE